MPTETLEFLKLIATELAMMSPVFVAVFLVIQGIKCLMRSEMLRIYYHHKEDKKLRQYEFENFTMLYKAYKALRGNSFIDKIHKEIETWDTES